MTEACKAKQCFHCDAKFESDEAFWDHVYNADCGSGPADDISATTTLVSTKPQPMGIEDANLKTSQEPLIEKPSSWFDCALCGVHFLTSYEWYAHSSSEEHKNMVATAAGHYATSSLTKKEKPSTEFKTGASEQPFRPFCDECQVPLPSQEARMAHVMGKKHQKVINRILKDNLFSAQTALGLSGSSMSSDGSVKDSNENLTPKAEQTEPMSKTHSFKSPFLCDYCSLELPDVSAVKHHLCGKEHLKMVNSVSDVKVQQSAAVPSPLMTRFTESDSKQLDDLVAVLRRLCLAQLTSLMYELEQGRSNSNGPIPVPRKKIGGNEEIAGIGANDVLELFRAVCREELQLFLSCRIPKREENPRY
ncbi:hypothetical protein D915_010079 [Fasciola hepatica]|uniref:C2H2-type domain-containing protein n=1 Tax=Fasciola hepatica TaxID=6192 RepID=A0A4E0RAV5_FASHE|nr:hypothetical protein D915_010079 [Fasciola hepatica]